MPVKVAGKWCRKEKRDQWWKLMMNVGVSCGKWDETNDGALAWCDSILAFFREGQIIDMYV